MDGAGFTGRSHARRRQLHFERLEDRRLLAVQPFADPFVPLGPPGSLVFDSAVAGAISTDTESFEVDLADGQTVTVALHADAGLRATVQLVDPNEVPIASATATSAGDDVFLQAVGTTTAGTYAVQVTGLDGTTGPFDVRMVLNGALELGDSDIGSPLAIDAAMLDLGLGRWAAVGRSVPVPLVPESVIDETNDTIANAVVSNIQPNGVFRDAGQIGDNPDLIAEPGLDVDLIAVALDAGDRIVADIDASDIGSTLDSVLTLFDATGAIVTQNDDENFFTRDARLEVVVEDSGLYYVGVSGWDNFGYDPFVQGSGTAESTGFYEITITRGDGSAGENPLPVLPDVDAYTLDLTGRAGHTLDILFAGHDANLAGQLLTLVDPDGTTTLATAIATPLGPDATNFDLAILDFVVPGDGVYRLRLESAVPTEYTLLVADGLVFEVENNNGPGDSLRTLEDGDTALGFAQPPRPTLLLGTSELSGATANDLVSLDVTTNSVVGSETIGGMLGMTADLENDRVLFTAGGGTSTTAGANLFARSIFGGAASQLGVVTTANGDLPIDGLAIADGTLYGFSQSGHGNDGPGLYEIDSTTLAATLVVAASGRVIGGIDADPATAIVYGADDETGQLVEIDVYAGEIRDVAAYPNDSGDFDGLAVGGGRVYLVPDGPGSIAVFNLRTGQYESPLAAPFATAEAHSGAALIHPPPPTAAEVGAAPLGVMELEINETPAKANPLPLGFDHGERTAIDVQGTMNVFPTTTLVPSEDDGSIPLANATGLMAGQRVFATAHLGDGPHAATTGDMDFYAVANVDAGATITIDVDAFELENAIDTLVGVYDSSGDLVASADNVDFFLDPFVRYVAQSADDYFVVVTSVATGLPADPFNPASGGGPAPSEDYEISIHLDADDVDFYQFTLAAGDIVGANVAGARELALRDLAGNELVGSRQDVTGVNHPVISPLPGGGDAALSWVVDTSGDYFVSVARGAGNYDLNLRLFRPLLEGELIGTQQTLFIDFDGATIDNSVFGLPGAPTLSPFVDFLDGWGLTPADENSVIDAILATVEENLLTDLVAADINGQFALEILNSRDHVDPFGLPHVSRVVVGGTTSEFGISTIGRAQSVDVGNFDTEETAVVLLDLLSAPVGIPETLNQFALDPSVSMIDLLGVALGNIVSHEAGHLFGNWHTEQFNAIVSLTDQGNNLANTIGLVGAVWGDGDEVDVDFANDTFVANEGFTGTHNGPGTVAFGLSAGKAPPAAGGDRFALPVQMGDRITLTAGAPLAEPNLQPGNPLDSALVVYDSAGEFLMSDLGGADGKNPLVSFVANSTGTFLVELQATVGAGAYLLEVDVLPSPVLIGDYNFDGIVNAADYAVWRDNLGATGAAGIPGDGDDGSGTGTPDGVVDQHDYEVWKANFGAMGPIGARGTAVAVVPPYYVHRALHSGLVEMRVEGISTTADNTKPRTAPLPQQPHPPKKGVRNLFRAEPAETPDDSEPLPLLPPVRLVVTPWP